MDNPPVTEPDSFENREQTEAGHVEQRGLPEGAAAYVKPGSRIKRRIDQPQEVGPPVQLPAFRDLQKLMSAIEDENVDFTDFCTAVRDVPQVKKVILRDAHSIIAGRVNRIENLKHAVAMLGLNKVRAILEHLAEPYEQRRHAEEQEAAEEIARVSA